MSLTKPPASRVGALMRLCLVMLVGLAAPGLAQQPDTARVVILGKVRDASTRQPIAGASVSTSDGTATATNEQGEFALATSMAGRTAVFVRRLGYDSLSAEVEAPSREARLLAERNAKLFAGFLAQMKSQPAPVQPRREGVSASRRLTV